MVPVGQRKAAAIEVKGTRTVKRGSKRQDRVQHWVVTSTRKGGTLLKKVPNLCKRSVPRPLPHPAPACQGREHGS